MSEPVSARWSLDSRPEPEIAGVRVQFTVPSSGLATLRLFSTLGQQLKTLYNGVVEPGRDYTVDVKADDLPSGFYLARLDLEGQHVMRRMLLTR